MSELRRSVVALGAASVAVAAALAVARSSDTATRETRDRSRLVENAARLLETPVALSAAPQISGCAAAEVQSAGGQTAREGEASPAALLLPLQELARRGARPDLTSLTQLTADEKAALSKPHRFQTREVQFQVPSESPPEAGPVIPDAIEGMPAATSNGDALAMYTISASLRTIDGALAPLALVSIRDALGAPWIRLKAKDQRGAWRELPGWFEVGESPLPGWRVIAISHSEATLLTSFGNLLTLRYQGDPPLGTTNRLGTDAGPQGNR